MAEIITYPVNGKDFSAEDVETYMCTRSSGVWAGDLDYTVTAETGDNRVTVGDGLAWMRMSRFSGKSHAHKGVTILDAGLPDARLPRIDAVVLQYRAGDLQGKLIIKKGTPASDPQPPKVERSASLYELHLFHIKRNVGATKITPNDLVDLREDEKYCGVMYDDVTLKGTLGFLTQKDKGVAGGVATLGDNGKVPSNQLPPAPDLSKYILKTDKGAANGVASLVNGVVPLSQLSGLEFVGNSSYSDQYGEATASCFRCGKICFAYIKITRASLNFGFNLEFKDIPAPEQLNTNEGITYRAFLNGTPKNYASGSVFAGVITVSGAYFGSPQKYLNVRVTVSGDLQISSTYPVYGTISYIAK